MTSVAAAEPDDRFLSVITPAPVGFRTVALEKRDLMGQPVAVYTDSLDRLLPLVFGFTERVQGVIVTPADQVGQKRLGPLLWQVSAPPDLLGSLRPLLQALLDTVGQLAAQRETNIEIACALERTRFDLDTVRSDYQRVTSRLQTQVQELLEAQRELADSESRLRQIVDLMPQLIYATDLQGRVLLANTAFARLLDEPVEALLGRGESELALSETWRTVSRKGNDSIQRNGQSLVLAELALQERGSERRVFQLAKLPFRLPGSSEEAVLTVASDISERYAFERRILSLNEELEQRVTRRTSELEGLNKELETFSYSVSHDLRSPLRAIHGFTQILNEELADQLNAEHADLFQRIIAAARRMNQLIDDMLTLARASKASVQREPVDLAVLAQQVFSSQHHLIGRRDVRLNVMPSLHAQADPRLLRLVLENLIGNAIKFTRSREVAQIEVGWASAQDTVAFFVRDNGAGFDMQWASKLFAPFQRLHNDQEYEGTGVGLATVKRVIQRHGGRIWAESSPDSGATFYFTLPDQF
ncbi:sensor histidine kinase [Chitinimonas lacunae]|uniref:histidine kinase n=1 Tax=Chitinimonas lacunae TaxID=1963018 RepID=A0ABV8MN27_9NEIS